MTAQTQDKDACSIVIIDSGMGGLSICADLAKGWSARSDFGRIRLTYFNAWPEQHRGYNALPNETERIRVFNAALRATEAWRPDMILIACNTLSILYPATPFAATTPTPVIGIVDFGVDLILKRLEAQPDSQAIIMGTLTTVGAQTHRQALIEKGIAPARITGQPCDQLATQIERDPTSERVNAMIKGFVAEAAAKRVPTEATVYAALCCTHYAYSQEVILHWLHHYFGRNVAILNPNSAMSEYVLGLHAQTVVPQTTVDIAVLSKIRWEDEKRLRIADRLALISPATAKAVRDYRYDPELFHF